MLESIEKEPSFAIIEKKKIFEKPIARGSRKEPEPKRCMNCDNKEGVLSIGKSIEFCTKFECLMKELKDKTKNLVQTRH